MPGMTLVTQGPKPLLGPQLKYPGEEPKYTVSGIDRTSAFHA